MDPLEHVLIKPAESYTESDYMDYPNVQRYDADSQSSRGAAGMTTGLRAASIASNMGELRLNIDRPSNAAGRPPLQTPTTALSPEEQKRQIKWLKDQWEHDLREGRHNDGSGSMTRELCDRLHKRTEQRRDARIQLVASRLAEASLTEHGRRAFKITIDYEIPVPPSELHAGGLHLLPTSEYWPAHVYTTAGVFGDHEGARNWLPCLDSASFKHRTSHELIVYVTAPMQEGMIAVGCGEDFGVSDTRLHYCQDANRERYKKTSDIIGVDHMSWIGKLQSGASHEISGKVNVKDITSNKDAPIPHVIPPDNDVTMTEVTSSDDEPDAVTAVASMQDILATHVWVSTSWMPIPARSLGFAIGPFCVVDDPEYFGLPDLDSESDEGGFSANLRHRRKVELERERERIEDARLRGEGIREAYFAPIFERKYIHAHVDTALLEEPVEPNITSGKAEQGSGDEAVEEPSSAIQINIQPRKQRQIEVSNDLKEAMFFGTAGVAHRALSLMRDILALPSYRTSGYSQIWIPNAVNGGFSCGALHSCPEVLGANAFLGGAIMDAGLLPPVGKCITFFHGGGRVLQMLQARCAIRGWIIACLPLGGQDDVGQGYIHSLIESFLMSLYERGHGAYGEGGAKGSMFYTKRYSVSSGLNSTNLDFLPVRNVEDAVDVAIGGVMAAVPVEDRNNELLWRSTSNGTESHTSGMDEFAVRQILLKDAVDVLERGTDRDKYVPMPSMGWLGSHLSLSFLSSNATSSSDLGGGALELVHATGGLVYRSLKTELLQRIVEGRAGVANFIRLVRAAFIASHLDDVGEKDLKMPSSKRDKRKEVQTDLIATTKTKEPEPIIEPPKPRFVICVNELMKKKGLTLTLFTRALQNLAGRIREALLLGKLVDVDRECIDPRTKRPMVTPEGFPNSYVKGASSLYLRVGVHVESAQASVASSAAANPGGIQLQAFAEPVIPEGGIAYSGPVTFRIVENEGQFREFVKDLTADGSRRDWGATHLHAKPVTTAKAQTAASGVIEMSSKDKAGGGATKGIFSSNNLHTGGYQAIELIRLTNLTPLLWVRVDPMGLYGGRISVQQPDACLAEQLFHDGDAAAQVEAMRHLAERPLRIQGSVKATSIYDVKVSELPVRVLADCLRGSPALHSSLPHTPAVRAQAALAIAQWQNNKAPQSRNAIGDDLWIGLKLLIQYFNERFIINKSVMPVKFTRTVLRKSEEEAAHEATATEGGAPNPNPKEDFSYQYLDQIGDGIDRATALEEAEEIGLEEDEEYRVRSAAIIAISSIRAKDGMTPPMVLEFLETILEGEDTEMSGNVVYPDEDVMSENKTRRANDSKKSDKSGFSDALLIPLPYVSSAIVADSLLALCFVNASPALITNPATGKSVQSTARHPVAKLMEISLRWLRWELYRESIRAEAEAGIRAGVGGRCQDTVAACAISALSSLAILRQSTTDPVERPPPDDDGEENADPETEIKGVDLLDEVTAASFYVEIFDRKPHVCDLTRAAAAQAAACVYCASDRFQTKQGRPVGLLAALEFLLERINDQTTSLSLKHSLSLLMMDACTGKICSVQRVATIGGRNELLPSAARFYNGPLGASHGGDSGSAFLLAVSPATYPAANAVNDGARQGLRMLSRAGRPKEAATEEIVVRVARFATNLWRTINGEAIEIQSGQTPFSQPSVLNGVCAHDGHLRCALLSLWQWIWPDRCAAVQQVQAWKTYEGTQKYEELGANYVMKQSDEEKAAAAAEEASLEGINRLVSVELERQRWRGQMAISAYEFNKQSGSKVDVSTAEQGLGQPLPPIQRDTAFRNGGWVASAAQQRRALHLDGGMAVTKLRLNLNKPT